MVQWCRDRLPGNKVRRELDVTAGNIGEETVETDLRRHG